MQLNRHVLFPAAILLAAFMVISEAQPVALSQSDEPNYYNDIEVGMDPEYVLDVLAQVIKGLEQRIRQNPSVKRGMDLGLGRGYSGSMTAKHLMGLASANYAGGPGRRRRSAPLV